MNMSVLLLQRAGPISLGIAPCACTVLSKLLLLLLLLHRYHDRELCAKPQDIRDI